MGSTAGLAPAFKAKVEALVTASHGAVSVQSGFRTYAQQLELRKANGCPDVLKSPPSACAVETAIPGTSKHEQGLAVDFGGDLNLAARLAPTYGLHRTIAKEPWHFEPIDSTIAPVPQQGGGATAGVVSAVAGAGGNLADSTVGPLLEGLKKVLVTGLILGGGLALLAAGAYRSSTGRSLADDAKTKTADTATAAPKAAAVVAEA